jgi:UDPglucose 6-dehydrogenase
LLPVTVGLNLGVKVGLLRKVEHINKARVDKLLAKVERALWVLRKKVIGVLGVAFKRDTDDIRGAPSLEIVRRLHGAGAILRVHDPAAMSSLKRLCPADDAMSSRYQAAHDAHALLILTDWQEFQSLDFDRIRSLMRAPIIVDGRNLFEPATFQAAGSEYYSLGWETSRLVGSHRGCAYEGIQNGRDHRRGGISPLAPV